MFENGEVWFHKKYIEAACLCLDSVVFWMQDKQKSQFTVVFYMYAIF